MINSILYDNKYEGFESRIPSYDNKNVKKIVILPDKIEDKPKFDNKWMDGLDFAFEELIDMRMIL